MAWVIQAESLHLSRSGQLTCHIFRTARWRLDHTVTVGAPRYVNFSPVICSDRIMGQLLSTLRAGNVHAHITLLAGIRCHSLVSLLNELTD